MKKCFMKSYVNPQYNSAYPDWAVCEDSVVGERRIKEQGELYLPMTEGQLADTAFGRRRYEAYKARACFYPYFSSGIYSMLGLMHRESPEIIELPEKIAFLESSFSADRRSLAEILRRVNFLQLTYGRCGILLDVSPENRPTAAVYEPFRILDWGNFDENEIQFVLLDDSYDDFDARTKMRIWKKQLRICALDHEGFYYTMTMSPEEYSSFDLNHIPDDVFYPKIQGRLLRKIPFEFINVSDTEPDIVPPPLLPLANLALAIYRGEADYRHALFMQGQATLFLKGFSLDDPPMMGAGNYIHTESTEADGRFLEISGSGLSEMRQALKDLHDLSSEMGMHLNETYSKESGEALKTRLAVKTALLRTIACTAGNAFEKLLRTAAEWCKADPETVKFKPNLDFSEVAATASEVVQLWNAKNAGLPVSGRSIHDWLRKNDYTDSSYDSELEEIRMEDQCRKMK